jgi:hypothetical protein
LIEAASFGLSECSLRTSKLRTVEIRRAAAETSVLQRAVDLLLEFLALPPVDLLGVAAETSTVQLI